MHQPLEQPYVKTGGALIGWMNVNWPFAELWTAPERLTITAQFMGTYTFTPEQIREIEPYIMLPIFGWGVRIRHCVPEYPERVIFWSLANPYRVLRGIQASGFIPAAAGPAAGSPRCGFPMRWSVIAGVLVLWNALLLADWGHLSASPAHPGWLTFVALLVMFVLSFGTLTSGSIQKLVLKPSRTVGEVRPLLRLLAFISGLLLFFLLLRPLAGGSKGAPNPRAAADAGVAARSHIEHPSPGASEHGRWPTLRI